MLHSFILIVFCLVVFHCAYRVVTNVDIAGAVVVSLLMFSLRRRFSPFCPSSALFLFCIKDSRVVVVFIFLDDS